MATDPNVTSELDSGPIGRALAERGPDFMLGTDIPRLWVTGAQVFVGPDITMVIFREQNTVDVGGDSPMVSLKNVSSLVMPTNVARDVSNLLKDQLDSIDGKPDA